MKTLKRILFFIAGVCLLIACSKSDSFWGDDFFVDKSKDCRNNSKVDTKFSPGTSYTFSGNALYKTWEVRSGKVCQDVANECVGTIEFLEGRNFKYTFTETRPNGNFAEFYGKISSSGVLTFKFPVPLAVFPDGTELFITDIIKSHACVAKIWGPGVNEGTLYFHGKFDGTRFTAEAKFMALIEGECPDLFLYPVQGLVHWIFGYDMTVVE